MKRPVVLTVRGRQSYAGQEPEIIELVTEGVMELCQDGWEISYEESELTGLEGVTTTFRVEQGRVILTRSGQLNSHMVFQEGIPIRLKRPKDSLLNDVSFRSFVTYEVNGDMVQPCECG